MTNATMLFVSYLLIVVAVVLEALASRHVRRHRIGGDVYNNTGSNFG